ASRLRRADRVEGDRGRVAAALGADEVRARARRPDLELLLCRGAKGVRGGDDDRAPVLAELGGELADRGRLAGAVDADDQEHAGPLLQLETAGLAEHPRDLFLKPRGEVVPVTAGLEPLNELGGGGHAD